jgi:hypothetical protein
VTDIDDALRRWAQEQTDDAPDVHVDPDRFGTGRRRPWLAPLAAAAAVLVVAAGVLVVRPWESGSRTFDRAIPLDRHSVTPPSVSPSASTRESVFHGLAIDVPKSWPDNATQCGTPIRNTVVFPSGGTLSCLKLEPAGVTSVTWSALGGHHAPLASAKLTTLVIGGFSATRSVGVVHSPTTIHGVPVNKHPSSVSTTHVVDVRVPKLSTMVTIESPSAALADGLAGTLHTRTRDPNGCNARNSLRTLSDVRQPTKAGAESTLIPGTPSRISICRYERGFFEQGTTLSPRDLESAVRVVNALPPGLSVTNPRDYLPAVCRPGNRFSDTSSELFQFQIAYPHGQTLTLAARLGYCGKLGITNGHRQGQLRMSLVRFLSPRVGVNVGVPDNVLPVR